MKIYGVTCPCCNKTFSFGVAEKDDKVNGVKVDVVFHDDDEEVA